MTPDEQARRERAQQLLACVQYGPMAHTQEDIMLSFAASEVRRALDELAKPGETSRLDEWIEDVGEEELAGPQLDDLTQAVRKDIAAALALAEQENAALRHHLERYQHGLAMLPDGTEALKTIKELRAEVERKDAALRALVDDIENKTMSTGQWLALEDYVNKAKATLSPVAPAGAPTVPLVESAIAQGRFCYVTTYRDGPFPHPVTAQLLFHDSSGANECARVLTTATMPVPATKEEP